MDYEMSLILASYLMGMHESRVTDCHIKNPEKILEILDDFSPLAEQKQTRYLPSARPAGILVTNYTKWN